METSKSFQQVVVGGEVGIGSDVRRNPVVIYVSDGRNLNYGCGSCD